MLKVTVCLTNYAGVDSTETFEAENMVNVARILITYKPTPQKRAMVTGWRVDIEEDLFSMEGVDVEI